jgi:uncharacterized delta-60 repeat protein
MIARRASAFVIATCLAAAVALSPGSLLPIVAAADGGLDRSFGDRGKVATLINDGGLAAIVLQPDGKILATGFSGSVFMTMRYTGDGRLDAGFGDGGKVTTDFLHFGNRATAIALQPDGKVLVVGQSQTSDGSNEFVIVRYQSDGRPDSGFGDGGKVVTDFLGGNDLAAAVALLPDGRIAVAGGAEHPLAPFGRAYDMAIALYTSDGRLDASFGSGGKVLTDFSGYNDGATAIAVLADGKLLVGGSSGSSEFRGHFALARYHLDGRLDTSFGTDGKAVGDFEAAATAMVLQPDGKIILAGTSQTNIITGSDFSVARFNPDGTPDTGFGSGGKVFTDFTSMDEAYAVALAADGQIVVAGSSYTEPRFYDFAVARYNPDGSLDPSFGDGGKLTTDFFRGFDNARGMAIQPDGKILVAGRVTNADEARAFGIARYDGGLPRPRISGATVSGKKLFVSGMNFSDGAVILLNDQEQGTRNDESQPGTNLIAKKGGKKIRPGDHLRVRNADGKLSDEFTY